MTGKATLSTTDSNTPQTDNGTSVLHGVREFVATHHDVSTLVRDAQKFSINLPLIGKVSVPTPRQLAVYGVIGALGATGAIEWPVALALGLGVAVAGRELGGRPPAPAQRALTSPVPEDAAPASPATTISVDGPAVVVAPTALVVSPSVGIPPADEADATTEPPESDKNPDESA